jgi:hypothetical protein
VIKRRFARRERGRSWARSKDMRQIGPLLLALATGCALLRPAPPTREELTKRGLATAIAERLLDEVWAQEGAGFLLIRPPTDTGLQRWDIRVRNVFIGRYPLMLRVQDSASALRIRLGSVMFGPDSALVSVARETCAPNGSLAVSWSNYVFTPAGTNWRFATRRAVGSSSGVCPPGEGVGR